MSCFRVSKIHKLYYQHAPKESSIKLARPVLKPAEQTTYAYQI